jgi:hypothetical protein
LRKFAGQKFIKNMKLFDLIRKKFMPSNGREHQFDYHEDDLGRVELRPAENAEEIKAELEQIDAINKNYSEPGGFSKVHVLEAGKVTIADRQIRTSELEQILQNTGFRKFSSITTGYGAQVNESTHTTGYGENGCALLFERNQGYVTQIWFDYYPAAGNTENTDKIFDYITELSRKWNLILVDWNQEMMVDSQNPEALRNYLNGAFGS